MFEGVMIAKKCHYCKRLFKTFYYRDIHERITHQETKRGKGNETHN